MNFLKLFLGMKGFVCQKEDRVVVGAYLVAGSVPHPNQGGDPIPTQLPHLLLCVRMRISIHFLQPITRHTQIHLS